MTQIKKTMALQRHGLSEWYGEKTFSVAAARGVERKQSLRMRLEPIAIARERLDDQLLRAPFLNFSKAMQLIQGQRISPLAYESIDLTPTPRPCSSETSGVSTTRDRVSLTRQDVCKADTMTREAADRASLIVARRYKAPVSPAPDANAAYQPGSHLPLLARGHCEPHFRLHPRLLRRCHRGRPQAACDRAERSRSL